MAGGGDGGGCNSDIGRSDGAFSVHTWISREGLAPVGHAAARYAREMRPRLGLVPTNAT